MQRIQFLPLSIRTDKIQNTKKKKKKKKKRKKKIIQKYQTSLKCRNVEIMYMFIPKTPFFTLYYIKVGFWGI